MMPFYFTSLSQTTVTIYFISSIYNIYNGNLDTSTWDLTFDIVVPFSTETLFGWYILFFIEFIMALSYAICMPTTTSYFVSSCFYIDAICSHFDALVASLKEDIQPKDDANGSKPIKVTAKMCGKFKVKLCNAIETHVKLYE